MLPKEEAIPPRRYSTQEGKGGDTQTEVTA